MKLFALPLCSFVLLTACGRNETGTQPVQSPPLLCSPAVDLPHVPTPLENNGRYGPNRDGGNGLVAFYHDEALNRLRGDESSLTTNHP